MHYENESEHTRINQLSLQPDMKTLYENFRKLPVVSGQMLCICHIYLPNADVFSITVHLRSRPSIFVSSRRNNTAFEQIHKLNGSHTTERRQAPCLHALANNFRAQRHNITYSVVIIFRLWSLSASLMIIILHLLRS